MNLVATLDARWGRGYFAAQAAAGAAWWVIVPLSPAVRHATLGDLPAGMVAAFDVPLFVIGSALAALGWRWAVWTVGCWTVLVAAGMALYATATGLGGWGALLMIGCAVCAVGAGLLVLLGRVPAEWLLVGPFAAREAPPAPRPVHLLRTGGQIVVFWGLFLLILPTLIALVERRWGLHVDPPLVVPSLGAVAFAAATALGLWSATTMASRGDGTPLPRATARTLVMSGPYRIVRNPMAVAGIAQGVAVGMMLGSWLVVGYALCGSLVWNHLIRPGEEADLLSRFGASYEQYRQRVSVWVPRRPRPRPSGTQRPPLVY
ncbi:methyltransferase family protein [Microbacterium sp. NPDC058345]|uniref:methyltransferase family protein n=1 Tax=Microbacterium sp. NPDC058345 TaxID=3346455 RepID=UPI00365E774D